MKPSSRFLQALKLGPARTKTIGFIGLGRMGSEMAKNLFSKQYANSPDHDFVICDALQKSALAFAQSFKSQFPNAQIAVVSSPEQVAAAARTVVTMLPSSPHVRAVYTESGGIISGLNILSKDAVNETLFIDSTTLDVEVARDIAKQVGSTGAQIVDAPVSGGVAGAIAGSLSFLVGGSKSAFILAQPVLTHMGKRIIHCGPSGAGLAAKICNNLVLGVEQIVVAEAMLLGQKLGLDPAVVAGVINNSTGGCWASSVNNPVPSALPEGSPPCERGYEGGFATALMLKDMGLATESAANSKIPLPLGEAAEKIYAEVIQFQPDLARKDFSSVYEYLRLASERGRRVHMGEVVTME